MTAICAVCNEQQSKYRCSLCEARYCSVSCYKTHKGIHHQDVIFAGEDSSSAGVTIAPTGTTVAPKTEQTVSNQTQGPVLADFSSNAQLLELLQSRPLLKRELLRIFEATQGPEMPDSFRAGRDGITGHQPHFSESENRRWTERKGEAQAVKMIARLRNDDTSGMADFIALLTQPTSREQEKP